MQEKDNDFPILITSPSTGFTLLRWATENRDFIQEKLLQNGALLLRGFEVDGIEEFESSIKKNSGSMMQHSERLTRRTHVSGNVYTTTEFNPAHRILMHTENSFAFSWPLRIFFHCVVAPKQGGETPIADVRKVLNHIHPETRKKFMQKEIMYVRNFGNSFGPSWETVFNTSDKAELEKQFRDSGIQMEWHEGDRLRIRQIRQAIVQHPLTGDSVWFNHATTSNIGSLEPKLQEMLLEEFERDDLPNNTYYGDGSEIDSTTLDEINAAYDRESVIFPWCAGDVMILDNMLVAHGREPFVPPRKIVAGMADEVTRNDMKKNRNRINKEWKMQ